VQRSNLELISFLPLDSLGFWTELALVVDGWIEVFSWKMLSVILCFAYNFFWRNVLHGD